MVKIRTICRPPELMSRETTEDIYKVFKNTDSNLHPLQKAREYTRALNSAKLEKIFAKPFVAALDEHTDSICSIARSNKYLTHVASGTYDGELKIWEVVNQQSILTVPEAHAGQVAGIVMWQDHVLTCGRDGHARLWGFESPEVLSHFNAHFPLTGIDHSWGSDTTFATSGAEGAMIWDYNRSHPVETLQWDSFDNLLTMKYNPSETSLIACSGSDCSVLLYDTRGATPVRKTIMKLKSNSMAWNPREPMMLTTANDDGNCYTFDIRKFTEVWKIHKDHSNSVMGISYSPVGREFATGGLDRTVRIFGVKSGRSREVYHTRRMHNVLAVEYSGDGKFILSGSDDANLRIWKAHAAESLKTLLPREKTAISYRNKLKQEYQHNPEIGRILRHRHLPKFLFNAKKRRQSQLESAFTKEENIKAHSRPGQYYTKKPRQKPVVHTIS